MKKLLMAVGIIALLSFAAAAQYHYGFYYDATGGQDLEIDLINTVGYDNGYVVTIFDAYGRQLWSTSGVLAGFESGATTVAALVGGSDYAWGVITIDSDSNVLIGLEYALDGQLVSIDTIYDEVPLLDPTLPFWLGAYYTQYKTADTAFILMNPWGVHASCTVTAYNANGDAVYTRAFDLGPYESEYVDLSTVMGQGDLLWGLLDVQMEGASVILALEYYRDGSLEIDNVTQYYY
jgi:hypothetical protein